MNPRVIARLNSVLNPICAVVGYSETGVPAFDPNATVEQRAAAQAAYEAMDLSDAAQAAWEQGQTVTQAVALITAAATNPTSMTDPAQFGTNAVIDAVCTLANNEFQALGRGRPLTAANIMAYLQTTLGGS